MRCLIWFFRVLIVVLAVIALARALHAQDVPSTFEVASVKRNSSDLPGNIQVLPNGVNVTNLPLRGIIGLAYGPLNPATSIEGPDWINTTRFDIVARTAAEVPSGELRGLLKTLLAERFRLSIRTEKRQLPINALVLARSDGRLGPQMKPSTMTCSGARGGPAECVPPPGGFGRIIIVGRPVSQLASLLSIAMMQTVRDKTGLTGAYDIDLSYAPLFAPESILEQEFRDRAPLFTALQEQLGLRMEEQKEEVDVVIIDRVEQPTEN